MTSSETIQATLRITKALADLQRIRILMMLRSGELCVCQIVETLALAPSTVSKHLSILSAAGLVDLRKDGKWAYYKLPQAAYGSLARPVIKWLGDSIGKDAMMVRDAKKLGAIVTCDPGIIRRRQSKR